MKNKGILDFMRKEYENSKTDGARSNISKLYWELIKWEYYNISNA